MTYLGYSATDGTYIPNSPGSVWQIADMAPGDCETLEIYTRFDQEGTFCNTAELIQQNDYDDVDSEEANDDGDQSEDDEDQQCIDIIFPKACLGDYVWKDLNQDGIQDTGEPAMGGVQVTLFDATTGLQVGSEFTNSSGNYQFDDIEFGYYYIEFDISGVTAYAECVPTSQNAGGTAATDSDILANGKTPVFNFDPSKGNNKTYDAGFHLDCEPNEASIGGN